MLTANYYTGTSECVTQEMGPRKTTVKGKIEGLADLPIHGRRNYNKITSDALAGTRRNSKATLGLVSRCT